MSTGVAIEVSATEEEKVAAAWKSEAKRGHWEGHCVEKGLFD